MAPTTTWQENHGHGRQFQTLISSSPGSTPTTAKSTSITPPSSTSAPSAPQSYASAVKSTTAPPFSTVLASFKPDAQAGVQKLLELTKSYGPKPIKPAPPARFSFETATKTRTYYLSGFMFQKIRTIRDALYESRFLMSKIVSLSWIGKTILEFIVTDDYANYFCSQVSKINSINILTDFDCRTNTLIKTSDAHNEAEERFALRIAKICSSTTNTRTLAVFQAMIHHSSTRVKQLYDNELATKVPPLNSMDIDRPVV